MSRLRYRFFFFITLTIKRSEWRKEKYCLERNRISGLVLYFGDFRTDGVYTHVNVQYSAARSNLSVHILTVLRDLHRQLNAKISVLNTRNRINHSTHAVIQEPMLKNRLCTSNVSKLL